jgi:hypothetical protein
MTDDTYAAARDVFDAYAGMDTPHLPPGKWSALQVRLFRWEMRNFGYQPAVRVAAGVAEETCDELFLALAERTRPEAVVDAVGDAMIYGTQVATSFRLDFGTIWETAKLEAVSPRLEPHEVMAIGAGRICHVALKSEQRIRGMDDREVARRAMANALGWLLAGARWLGEVHRLDIENAYFSTAEEVLKREWRRP